MGGDRGGGGGRVARDQVLPGASGPENGPGPLGLRSP